MQQFERLSLGAALFLGPRRRFLHPLEVLQPQRQPPPSLGCLGSGVVDS